MKFLINDSLKDVCIHYRFEKSSENKEVENVLSQESETQKATTSCYNFSHYNYFNCIQGSNDNNQNDDAMLFELNKTLDNEISIYADLIGNFNNLNKINKTSDF